MKNFLAKHDINMSSDYEGHDISNLFDFDTKRRCTPFDIDPLVNTHGPCSVTSPYGGVLSRPSLKCLPSLNHTKELSPKGIIVFDWSDIKARSPDGTYSKLSVIGDKVYNFTYYVN